MEIFSCGSISKHSWFLARDRVQVENINEIAHLTDKTSKHGEYNIFLNQTLLIQKCTSAQGHPQVGSAISRCLAQSDKLLPLFNVCRSYVNRTGLQLPSHTCHFDPWFPPRHHGCPRLYLFFMALITYSSPQQQHRKRSRSRRIPFYLLLYLVQIWIRHCLEKYFDKYSSLVSTYIQLEFFLFVLARLHSKAT